MTCGILNLADCIVEKFGDFILSIINAPLKPFLDAIKLLLTQPANIQAFAALWGVMVYVISAFYGIFILLAGLNFIISGYNAERRERAKEWLQNTLLMIFFVQASFYVYLLTAELASTLTAGVVNMISPQFFLLTLDNPVNLGLEIVLGLGYLLVLLITVIVFSINYFFASIGVLFFPFGLFFYFIPPLRDIGRFIISKLAFVLFFPFFAGLILLGTSRLIGVGAFSNIKIVLMIAAFLMVDVLLVLLAVLALVRAVMGLLRSDLARAFLFVKGHAFAAAPDKAPPNLPPHLQREYYRDQYRRERRER
jgi:hypothetical protein